MPCSSGALEVTHFPSREAATSYSWVGIAVTAFQGHGLFPVLKAACLSYSCTFLALFLAIMPPSHAQGLVLKLTMFSPWPTLISLNLGLRVNYFFFLKTSLLPRLRLEPSCNALNLKCPPKCVQLCGAIGTR